MEEILEMEERKERKDDKIDEERSEITYGLRFGNSTLIGKKRAKSTLVVRR